MTSERTTTVSVDDGHIAVAERGSGRPILLIHAYPMRRQLYRDVVEPLAHHGRVITCDNRGFGQSSVTDHCVTIDRYADDLIAVLDALDVDEPAAVAGVSMGGYIAMNLATRYPDRVAGLLLCNTRAAADTADAAAKRESLAAKIEAEGAQVCRGVPQKLLGGSTQRQRPELIDELREWILATDANGIAAALRGMAGRADSTDMLRDFAAPVHFIAGNEDTFTPHEEMTQLANDLGRGITVIEGSGHLSPIEQPAAFVDAFTQTFLPLLSD